MILSKKLLRASLLTLFVAAGILHSHANFNATLRTTISDASNSAAVRFFNQGAPNGPGVDPSEAGDPVWLVFDVDGGGVFNPGALNGVSYNGTVEDLIAKLIQPGDFVIRTNIPGPIEGRMATPLLGLPSNLQTGGSGPGDAGGTVRPSVAILFDDANLANGGTFGFDDVAPGGVIPSVGNVDLRVGQDVFANRYTFTVGGGPSQPVISNPVYTVNGANVVFEFNISTANGTSSQVQSATNLNQPIQWTDEGSPIAGDGTAKLVSVTTPLAASPEKYFRVKVQ